MPINAWVKTVAKFASPTLMISMPPSVNSMELKLMVAE